MTATVLFCLRDDFYLVQRSRPILFLFSLLSFPTLSEWLFFFFLSLQQPVGFDHLTFIVEILFCIALHIHHYLMTQIVAQKSEGWAWEYTEFELFNWQVEKEEDKTGSCQISCVILIVSHQTGKGWKSDKYRFSHDWHFFITFQHKSNCAELKDLSGELCH